MAPLNANEYAVVSVPSNKLQMAQKVKTEQVEESKETAKAQDDFETGLVTPKQQQKIEMPHSKSL